jgi:hypothetical protein
MRKPQAVVACGFRVWRALRGRRENQCAPGNRNRLELRVLIVAAHFVHAVTAVLTKVPVTPALAVSLTVLTEVAAAPAWAILATPTALAEALMAPALTVLTTVIHGVPVFMRPQDARQHREAGLLCIIEALVQWCSGVSDLLKRGATLGHRVRPV